MNKNKAFMVVSIKELRSLLRAAVKSSKESSAHPGKINSSHCQVIEMDLLGEEHNSEDGQRHARLSRVY